MFTEPPVAEPTELAPADKYKFPPIPLVPVPTRTLTEPPVPLTLSPDPKNNDPLFPLTLEPEDTVISPLAPPEVTAAVDTRTEPLPELELAPLEMLIEPPTAAASENPPVTVKELPDPEDVVPTLTEIAPAVPFCELPVNSDK